MEWRRTRTLAAILITAAWFVACNILLGTPDPILRSENDGGSFGSFTPSSDAGDGSADAATSFCAHCPVHATCDEHAQMCVCATGYARTGDACQWTGQPADPTLVKGSPPWDGSDGGTFQIAADGRAGEKGLFIVSHAIPVSRFPGPFLIGAFLARPKAPIPKPARPRTSLFRPSWIPVGWPFAFGISFPRSRLRLRFL